MGGEKIITAQRQKSALCVSLPRSGKPLRMDADTPADFLQIIKDSEITWVNCSIKDVEHNVDYVASMLGFNSTIVENLVADLDDYSSYDDQESQMGLVLPSIKVTGVEVKFYPLFIFIRRGLILTVHEQEEVRFIRFARYADIFMRKIKHNLPWNDKITVMLNRIIDENNEINFDGLQSIQRQAINLDHYLLDSKIPRIEVARRIYGMKKALIQYLNMLWSTMTVINFLRYGDADTISDSNRILSQVALLGDDVTRQISIAESLSNVLTGGLEVMQTIYNNQLQELSNRLSFVVTWLTILGTAILIPNTLGTIFGIPAVSDALGGTDSFGLLSAILLLSTVGAVWVAYLLVKRMKWSPPDFSAASDDEQRNG